MKKKTLLLDCSSGISGDMMVAALLDLGADERVLLETLASLPLEGYRIQISRVKKSGIDACDFNVILDAAHENHDHDTAWLHDVAAQEAHANGQHAPEQHVHSAHGQPAHSHTHGRGLDEITTILYSGLLSDRALSCALRIFEIVAQAEAQVHGLPIDQVHFHEVGAVDSIIDIAAVAICIDNLGIEDVIVTSLTEGTGQVRCQHGLLPIPVPATSAIVSAHHIPLHIIPLQGELVTPTGAAIAAALRTRSEMPPQFTFAKVGMGAGKRDYPIAGILRAILIKEAPGPSLCQDRILKLETNIDDCSGEALGFVTDQLFRAGAADVWHTPIYMKKGRPATLLSVLCAPGLQDVMEEILFRHTTCIGIRFSLMQRHKLPRETKVIPTPLGDARVKVCSFQEEVYLYPESDSVTALSEESGLNWQDVYHLVKTSAIRILAEAADE